MGVDGSPGCHRVPSRSITPTLQYSNTPFVFVKIAVVGCGAVGSFYGAKLARAGHEVHFLLRSDYDVVRRQGVLIRSPEGDFQVRPHCARTPGGNRPGRPGPHRAQDHRQRPVRQTAAAPGRARHGGADLAERPGQRGTTGAPVPGGADHGRTVLRLFEPRRAGGHPAHRLRAGCAGRVPAPARTAHA